MCKLIAILICCGFFLLPDSANAYVGPGAGLSLLGALWALIVAVGTALVFILAWPIRRMRRRKREAKESAAKEREPQEQGTQKREVQEREAREHQNTDRTKAASEPEAATIGPEPVVQQDDLKQSR